MTPQFSVHVNAATSTVHITLSGFFDDPEILRFVESMKNERRHLRCDANAHSTVVDIRGMIIQSRGSVEAFARILDDPAYAGRRIAFVVSAGLLRAQVRRAAAGRGALFCSSFEEAEAWLRLPLASTPSPVVNAPAKSAVRSL